MNRSILFELGRWDVGGVERVTVVLANEFVRRGWRVAVSAFEIGERLVLRDLESDVEVVELSARPWFSEANRMLLAEVLWRREVSVVVNQWCVNCSHTRFLRRAMDGTGATLVAVHHNRPDLNKRIMDARNPLLRFLWRKITAFSLRKVYAASDRYVVLSPSFIDLFADFAGIRDRSKLAAIPNPVTLAGDAPLESKENVVLFVGRLEETQKRVSRVVALWRTLAVRHSDWRLEIVGDGPDRGALEASARDLPRIRFAGFQPPADYYARAKILVLPSDFEGFPLVLCEAMSFGCVPVALGSYAAATDVLGKGGGVVVEMPWDDVRFAGAVEELMSDEERWASASRSARERAADFSVRSVVDRYEKILNFRSSTKN